MLILDFFEVQYPQEARLDALGQKLDRKNTFGCFVSPRVTKYDAQNRLTYARADDFIPMYTAMLSRLKDVYSSPQKTGLCPRKIIVYEKVALAHADRENELMADLKLRTGLDIKRLEVGHIDYLKDIAYVKIYYTSDKPENTVNQLTKIKPDNVF